MKIKLCGIKRPQDILYINEFLPDYIGFVFAKSKRFVTADEAKSLKQELDPSVQTVGVFVNEPLESLVRTVNTVGLDVVQLHGEEENGYIFKLKQELPGIKVWKAVRVETGESIRKAGILEVETLILDSFSKGAYGGTGKLANWDIIKNAQLSKPFFLAGGLDSSNLKSAAETLHPFGVDLSGGIETAGVKDKEKIKAVMKILRG